MHPPRGHLRSLRTAALALHPDPMPHVSVTDEVLDAYVNRPLASHLVRWVAHYPSITPNSLTALSALFGTLAGVGLVVAPAVGAVCLFLCMVVDCGDGQLARQRGGGTLAGRIWDGYADYWVAFAVHLGMLLSLIRMGVTFFGHRLSSFELFFFVLAAGVSMAVNAGHFDYEKQRYLAHTGASREPESPELYLRAAQASQSRVERVLLLLFARYVAAQVGQTAEDATRAARFTASDAGRVQKFRSENDRLVRLWSLSGPTMHSALIAAAALIHSARETSFVAYCLFAIVAVNGYGLVLRVVQHLARRRHGVH